MSFFTILVVLAALVAAGAADQCLVPAEDRCQDPVKHGFVICRNSRATSSKFDYCKFENISDTFFESEQKAGGPYLCDTDAKSGCSGSHSVTGSAGITNSIGGEVEIDLILAALKGKYTRASHKTKTKSSTMSCSLEAGHQAEIKFVNRMRNITGTLNYFNCSRSFFGKVYEAGQGKVEPFTITVPVLNNDGELDGSFRCTNYRLIANTTELHFDRNQATLTPGPEYDAVGSSFHWLRTHLPPQHYSIVQSGYASNGTIRVWAKGQCFNMHESHTYKPNCHACLKHLTEHVWSRSGNARGATWRVKDCYLRYEFFPLESKQEDREQV